MVDISSAQAESESPDIDVVFTSEIDGFDLEELAEATPEQIPDGLPYEFFGCLPCFMQSETKYGSTWVSYTPHDSDPIGESYPAGIEFGKKYVNWQGRRYTEVGGGSVRDGTWQEVDIPSSDPSNTTV